MSRSIDIEDIGLASILSGSRLKLPPHQRNYAWKETQVKQYFQDLYEAIDSAEQSNYFFATIKQNIVS